MSKKPNFHIIAKATCGCNINCEYCYDRKNRERLKGMIMSDENLEHTIKLLSEYADRIDWLWHGGEPTTIPIEWYDRVQELFYKYYNSEFIQSMQSNGVNFIKDSELLNKFRDLGIEAGLSFDILTQAIRLGKTSDEIMENYIELLKKNAKPDGEIGALTVVTNQNIDKLIDMYEYMKVNFREYQYEMSLLFVSQHQEEEKTLEVPKDKLLENLDKFYKHVIFDDSDHPLLEHNLNEYLTILMHRSSRCTCNYVDCRKTRIGVQPDGEVLYCDTKFHKYPLGYIQDYNSVEEIFESENYKNLCDAVQRRYDNECSKCAYFNLCKGGCNHTHMDTEGNIDKCNPHVCDQFKSRIHMVYKYLQEIDRDTVINHRLAYLIESKTALLPKEVEYALSRHGLNVSLKIDDLTDFPNNPKYQLYSIFTTDEPATRQPRLFTEERYTRFDGLIGNRGHEIREMVKYINELEG